LLDDGCCNSLYGLSDVPSTNARSTFISDVLRGLRSFPLVLPPCGLSLGSLDPGVRMLVFDFLACSSEGFRLRLFCSRNSSVDCSAGRTEWRISLWMAAYRRSMAVKRALPSRCLQNTVLSASALAISFFHTAPFPFTGGEKWMSCLIVCRPVLRSASSSEQSGCPSSSHRGSSRRMILFCPAVFRTLSASSFRLLCDAGMIQPGNRAAPTPPH
jgi:hypothetical protein